MNEGMESSWREQKSLIRKPGEYWGRRGVWKLGVATISDKLEMEVNFRNCWSWALNWARSHVSAPVWFSDSQANFPEGGGAEKKSDTWWPYKAKSRKWEKHWTLKKGKICVDFWWSRKNIFFPEIQICWMMWERNFYNSDKWLKKVFNESGGVCSGKIDRDARGRCRCVKKMGWQKIHPSSPSKFEFKPKLGFWRDTLPTCCLTDHRCIVSSIFRWATVGDWLKHAPGRVWTSPAGTRPGAAVLFTAIRSFGRGAGGWGAWTKIVTLAGRRSEFQGTPQMEREPVYRKIVIKI